MPSAVWTRTIEKAFDFPYAYDAQKQFLQEADTILAAARTLLLQLNMKFTVEDQSVEKATWMLQFDALDALADALFLFRENRPSAAGRMFRDVLDTLDVAEHFTRGGEASRNDLAKWYSDDFVKHARARESAGQERGEAAKKAMADEYGDFSRFVHRTYRIVQRSYGQGVGERIWNDSELRDHGHPMPQTVAEFLTIYAQLILYLVKHLQQHRTDVDATALAAAIHDVFAD
jgi:hypothetical protein